MELREVEERIVITQDRIDGGSLTYPRAELLKLRQELRHRAERLQQSIAAHARTEVAGSMEARRRRALAMATGRVWMELEGRDVWERRAYALIDCLWGGHGIYEGGGDPIGCSASGRHTAASCRLCVVVASRL